MRITLKEAEKFHGHLGPYLILGILSGEYALKRLGCKKYFGLQVKVWGATEKPKSCLVDGLQLSTGATYGKGNIHKLNGNNIKILINDSESRRSIKITLKRDLIINLNCLKGHKDSEAFAKRLYKTNPLTIFNFRT